MSSISLLRRLALITAIVLVTIAAAGLARTARTLLLPSGSLGEHAGNAASILEVPTPHQARTRGISSSLVPGAVDASAASH